MKRPSAKTIAFTFRVLLGVVLLLIGSSVFQMLKSTAKELETTDPADRTIRVQVMVAEQVTLSRQWRGFGTTMAEDTADVPARVGAPVQDIPDGIEVGRVVRLGQTIAQLDATDFEQEKEATAAQLAEIDAALAQLAVDTQRLSEQLALEEEEVGIAQDEYDRQLGYLENERAVQQDVDRAQRALLAARRQRLATEQAIDGLVPRKSTLDAQRRTLAARHATAVENVNRCEIKSPMDGIIEVLDIEEDENVAPGQRIARIIDPRIIEVPLQLPASARREVEVGNTVSITMRNLPHDCPPWTAEVTRIGISNDTATRTFTAYARLEQADTALSQIATGGGVQRMPVGAFVASTLTTNDAVPRWVVPARAIREGRVRLIVDSTIRSRAVRSLFEYEGELPQLGLPDTQWVVLETELEPGELIVVNASVSVLDGQYVEPIFPGAEHRAADADTGGAEPSEPDDGAQP